jgi:hypothetical protein
MFFFFLLIQEKLPFEGGGLQAGRMPGRSVDLADVFRTRTGALIQKQVTRGAMTACH